jgi:hypothetical protein
MKIHRKKIPGIIVLFVVFACSEITVYANFQIWPVNLEASSGTSKAENRFSSEINTFEDDQIRHSNEVISIADFRPPMPITRDYSLVLMFFWPIWQPPKIS